MKTYEDISFEELYNHAPCGYHSLAADGTIMRINDTELNWLGYKREEIIGKIKYFDLIHSSFHEKVKYNFELFKKQGFIKNAEYQIVRKDGSTFPILINATAIYDESGNYLMSRSMVMDLSEKKNLETELWQLNESLFILNQEKNRFIGIASHDLQNPLTNLRLLIAKFRKTDKNLSEAQSRWIEELDELGNRMSNLVKNLLNVNRIERQASEPILKEIDVIRLIHRTLSRFETIAAQKAIRLHFSSFSESYIIKTDDEFLTEILENLISNAIKFSFSKSKIEVKIEQENTTYIISIKDEGQGFEETEIPLLFGRFQKLSAKPTAGETSSGLGLSIVKDYAEKLNGKIEIQSKKHAGSTFRLVFEV